MVATLRQIANAIGTMPIVDNALVHGVRRALGSGLNRATVAALATGAYAVYSRCIAEGASFGDFLPALPLVGGTALNVPVAAFLVWSGLELVKQGFDACRTYSQNSRQDVLKGELNALLVDVNQKINDLANISVQLELIALGGAFQSLSTTVQGQRSDAELVQDREQLEHLKKVQTRIFSIKARFNANTPIVLRNELNHLITNNNQLDANSIQNTLVALDVLDQQLALEAEIREKILTLESAKAIRAQKTEVGSIKLTQERIIPEIASLKSDLGMLKEEVLAIQLGTDKGQWYTVKSLRLSKKQAEINAKEGQINRLTAELQNLPGLSRVKVDTALARLQQLPLPHTAQTLARIQSYLNIKGLLDQIHGALPKDQPGLREQLQMLPCLQPQALQTELDQLDGELTQFPAFDGAPLQQVLTDLNQAQQALNGVVNSNAALGVQKASFEAAVKRIPAPLLAPAQPAAAAVAAAAGPVDFSVQDPANPQGPRIQLDKCSPFPVFQVPGLAVGAGAMTYDIAVPRNKVQERWGAMCFGPVLSAVVKLPHLVRQLSKTIKERLNDGAEREFFGSLGAGGIGIKTQTDNPQCSPEVLTALLEVACCFRNPGSNALEVLTRNLTIIEKNLSKIRGLTRANKEKISEMVILLNLFNALGQGRNISEDSFKDIIAPFMNRYGPFGSNNSEAVSHGMAQRLEALVMGKDSDMPFFPFEKLQADKKHALICVEMPLKSTVKEIPETIELEVAKKKIKYKVVSVLDIPDQTKLEAVTYTRSEKVWSSYDPRRAKRVLPDTATRADGQARTFNRATLFAVPVN